jgi:hypothetical protein
MLDILEDNYMFKKMNVISSILYKDRFWVPGLGHRMSFAEVIFSLAIVGAIGYFVAVGVAAL